MAKQFTFKGRITVDHVDVHVTAETESEARAKAECGRWDEADYNTGEPVVYKISLVPAAS